MFNYELLRHPYNWAVVILMLALGFWAIKLVSPEIQQLRPGA